MRFVRTKWILCFAMLATGLVGCAGRRSVTFQGPQREVEFGVVKRERYPDPYAYGYDYDYDYYDDDYDVD